jgi:serine/threonine-protein kinase
MPDDPRIQRLLDELLESGGSPEELCAACPELLPKVRSRWRQIRRLTFDLDSMFPASGRQRGREEPELPVVPGYQVEGVLGRGGMGIVFRARHLRLNRAVALKMLLSGAYAVPAELKRFVQEAEAVAALRHPNIVQVYDAGDIDGNPYFTMELVEGGRLSQKVAGTPLPARDAALLVATVAAAIHTAHEKGIIHRDLNPSNILLTADGTPKVTDFGLARRLEGGGGITLTGLPVGTPSYMAPEQARGNKASIGPATDVYALGAILYDLLTGRPPFRADSAAATLHQVVVDDPVSPARLNRRVPRDLETISLKCLQKQPTRRYATALELADDLGRFLRDEPIAARPPTRVERSVRWVRRHPAAAVLLVVTVLLAAAAAGVGGWVIGQRSQTARAVEGALPAIVDLQQTSDLPEARARLEHAQLHVGQDGPARLRRLLDRAWRDQQLLERLDAIRMTRSTFDGRDNHPADVRFNNARADREYQAAFREGGLGEPPDGADGAAVRVKASAVRVPLLAALDDWAVCIPGGARRDWVLRVARGADPDDWRDRVRDPAAWEDGAALAELARTAPVEEQAPPILLALGERLQLAGGDGIDLLRRVREQYPDDFWVNFTVGRVLYGAVRQGTSDWTAVIPYYRKALDIRPKSVAVQNNLGLVLMDVGWLDDNADGHWGPGAISILRGALRIAPEFAPARNNLGLCLKRAGIWWVAIHEYQDALRADPNMAPAHFSLGEMDAGSGRVNDAIGHYREALRVDPDFAPAHYFLGLALLAKGRVDAVFEDYPVGVESLSRYHGSALSEAIALYWKTYECDPEWVLARNGLHTPPQDAARLDEAIDHYRQAVRLEPGRFRSHGALGQALRAKRQFADADAALARCLELLPPEETKVRGNLERLRERCRRLLGLEGRVTAIVRGTDRPDAGECLDAAEVCYVKQHFATAARLYTEALEATPKLTEDLRAGHRFNAACAAAMAGSGCGDDAAALGADERTRLRGLAREWLRLDLVEWSRKLEGTDDPDRIEARKALARWRNEPDLAGLRDSVALGGLPPTEQSECLALWAEVEAKLTAARPAE